MRLLILTLILLCSTARADLFDRVVAVVEDQLVLDSEVRLEEALSRIDTTAMPFWAPTRATPMERLIDASVVRLAASNVALYQPDDTSVVQRREAIRSRFPDRKSWTTFLAEHGMSEDDLDVVIRRRLVVERYLSRNLQVSVEERAEWKRASAELVQGLRDRMKVRVIPEEP